MCDGHQDITDHGDRVRPRKRQLALARLSENVSNGVFAHKGRPRVPLDQYERNLNTIVERLKKTNARLIFATMTPVPPGEPQRKTGDELAYDAGAVKRMKQQRVAVDDLWAFMALPFDQYAIQPGNVHFKPEAYALLAK